MTVQTDFPQRFQLGAVFFILPPLLDNRNVTIEGVKEKNKKLIVKLSGINDRDQAQAAGGRLLAIAESDMADLPPDAYWHHELIGLKVITSGGIELGRVKEIMSAASNDIYLVGNGKEYLIPAIGDVVKEVNLETGLIIIEPLPGLLD